MRKFMERFNRRQRILIGVCALVLILCAAYMVFWNLQRDRILADNARYGTLYSAAPSADAPHASPLPTITAAPTAVTNAASTAVPTAASTAVPTAATTAAPTDTPASNPTATFEVIEDDLLLIDLPRATPDENTIVMRLQTPPPVQESFADLLAKNPETVGFLTIGDWMALPVVQRANDNDFYLNHNFDGESSFAGTLFLDGSNLLVPEDDALIVYGHNMKNGTMLAGIVGYESEKFLAENAIVHFDTIYENRVYVPFAVFSVSAEQESEGFFNFRQFAFDETTFELFALKMKDISQLRLPVDVRVGDHILLLVTCEYAHNNGRFIVALRQLRENESEDEIRSRFAELP